MRVKSRDIDMCSGPLFLNILKFAWPFMLTGLLQRLYNAADVIVVGRYAGQEALAGVGATGNIVDFSLNFFLGLAAGVGVVLGQALGARDGKNIRKIVHTSMALSAVGGVVIAFFNIVFTEPLLRLMDVPDNVMPHAKIYMQIVSVGHIPSLIYNFGAAVLRAKGDTKRPMYIVMVSGIINVGLNVFFVTQLGMKSDGVALATVISQVFTAAAIVRIMCRETDETRLHFSMLRIEKTQLTEIVKVGIPSGIQSSIFSFANVIVQSSINSFGSAAIAGSSAAANIAGFYLIALNTFYQASAAFVSQNMGAKKYGRINKIVYWCLLDSSVLWILQALLTVFAGEFMLNIYTPGDAEAIKWGLIRLNILGCTYGMCGFMNVMSGALRGMGHSFKSMVASVAGVCGIRIVWVMTVFKAVGTFESLCVSYPLSWLGTFIMHTVMFLYVRRKLGASDINETA